MIFCDKENNLRFAKDENEKIFFALIQEIKLFKGENPLDFGAGVDYISIFNKTAFLQIEIQKIIEKYKENFKMLECSNIIQNDEVLEISINAAFKNGSVANETLLLI